jgi:inosine-uridine nucleoside N-ribohydrolase
MYHVIMDCDPGHDDAIALLLASRADNIRILGVTTVAGNSYVENTTLNASKVLDFAGVTDVDVYPGCERPMMHELWRLTGAIIHGEDGLGGPRLPDPVTPVKAEHAVSFIIRTLRESAEKVTLIVTGPMTNIAQVLIQAPDVKENIERIVIMGGAIRDPGNITSAAEFNVFQDPEAAKILFASGVDIDLNTLDVSMKAVFYKKDIERLRDQKDAVSVIVAQFLDFFGATHIEHFGFPACPIHDALCVGCLIDERLIEWEHTYVDISTGDELTRGETVADLWGITGHRPNCRISTKVDRERFVNMICDHMKRPYISKR